MKSKLAQVVAMAVAALLLSAGSAVAADFCVGVSPLCPVADQPATAAGINTVLTAAVAADHEDHVIHLAAADYPISASTFSVSGLHAHDGRIDILGQGPGVTKLSGEPAAYNAVIVLGLPTADSVFGGFTLDVTQPDVQLTYGIELTKGTLSDFEVKQVHAENKLFYAVDARQASGAIRRGRIIVGSSNAVGMLIDAPGSSVDVTLDDLEIDGSGAGGVSNVGVRHNSSPGPAQHTRMNRVAIRDFVTGVQVMNGTLTLADSVVDLGANTFAQGVLVGVNSYEQNPPAVKFTAVRNTIVGSGASQTGFNFYRDSPDVVGLWARIVDSVIVGSGTNFKSVKCGATTDPPELMEAQNWAAQGNTDGCDLFWSAASTAPSAFDPAWFVDVEGGDYRPLKSSPLVDGGSTTAEVPAGALDLDGGPRVSGPAVDIGAFEYQHAAPAVTLTASTNGVAPGEPVGFTATAHDADDDPSTLALNWQVDGAVQPGGGLALTHAFAQPGGHTVSFTATDPTGLSGTASVVVSVVAPDQAAPVERAVARLRAKPKKAFKRGKKSFSVMKPAKTKKAKRKAKKTPSFTVRFTSTTRAKLVLQRKSGEKYRALRGTQTLRVKNGNVKLTFGGGWNKKRLKRGTYRLRLTPVNSAGTSGRTISVVLRVR